MFLTEISNVVSSALSLLIEYPSSSQESRTNSHIEHSIFIVGARPLATERIISSAESAERPGIAPPKSLSDKAPVSF